MLRDSVANGEDSATRPHDKSRLSVGIHKTGKTPIKFGKPCDCRGAVSQHKGLERCLKLRARAKVGCDAMKVNDFGSY
jgi:hypothetical protein